MHIRSFLMVGLQVCFLQLYSSFSSWNDVVKYMGHDRMIRSYGLSNERWRNDLFNALNVTERFRSKPREEIVFYPFSGCDVGIPLALNTEHLNAKHIILTSQEAAIIVDTNKQHLYNSTELLTSYRNRTFLVRARRGAREIFQTGRQGFLLGHLMRAFALEFGMLPLLLTSLSTVKNLWVKDVRVGSSRSDVEISCCYRNAGSDCFSVQYMAINLHNSNALQLLSSQLNDLNLPVTTVIKAVDEGGLLTQPSLITVTPWERSKLEAARKLSSWLVDISSTIIQDITGIHTDAIWSSFSSIDLFGTFIAPCDDRVGSKEAALAKAFSAARTEYFFPLTTNLSSTVKWHNLPPLQFGHCMIPWPCHARSINRLLNMSLHFYSHALKYLA